MESIAYVAVLVKRPALRNVLSTMISNLRKYVLLAALMSAALVGCAPEKPSEARLRGEVGHAGEAGQEARPAAEIEKEAVVRVDGEEISLGEFNRRLQEMPEFARARFSTTEQKQSYLDSVAQFELMADVAEQRGYGDRPQVRYALEEALAGRLVEQVTGERLSMDDIGDEAVQSYYDSHLDEFITPEARRVALIEVDTREEAEELRERVLEQMDEASDSAINAFRRAAARHSVDRATAKEGGDIGFVERPGRDAKYAHSARQQLAREVFELEAQGAVTDVFQVDTRFGLATFFEERKRSVVSLEEASGGIRAKLFERRKQDIEQEFIAELAQSAAVERFPEALDTAKAPPAPGVRRVEDIPVSTQPAFGPDEAKTDENTSTSDPEPSP